MVKRKYMSVKINELQISRLNIFELVIYTKKNLQILNVDTY